MSEYPNQDVQHMKIICGGCDRESTAEIEVRHGNIKISCDICQAGHEWITDDDGVMHEDIEENEQAREDYLSYYGE